MADASSIPQDLAQVAGEKGIPVELIQRALALGFPADAIKGQLSMPGVTAEATEAFIVEQERIRAGGEVTIPPHLAAAAAEHDWPEALVVRALKLGAQADFMINQIKAGITAQQAERFIEQQERAREGGGIAATLDLGWMHVPTEWGVRVRPGKKGLTIGGINVGTYADIPDVWPYRTEMPRGAYPIAGVPAMGYSIFEKAELWAENAADLYEEAIQRRWRPSTDIPWTTMQDLPEETEKAVCQVCTWLCEKALLAGDVTGKWLPEMSYGYHEIKLYLASAAYDYAHQFEVFRKRALSNGGGMGLQSPGYFHRALIDARAWTEASAAMHILDASHTMMVLQIGEYTASSEAESQIYRYAMQDVARQMAYGIQHLKFFLMKNQPRRAEVHNYPNKAEAIFIFEDEKDVPLREALTILLGGGASPELMADGHRKLEYFRARFVRDYLSRLAAAGVPERKARINVALRKYVPQEEEAAVAAAV
ncbi:MAG TPA: hypothetical protein VFO59_02670 [Dehalococcoidia bacterium]|nr:hypothetical protein [Dehalococcoidia bacterium]